MRGNVARIDFRLINRNCHWYENGGFRAGAATRSACEQGGRDNSKASRGHSDCSCGSNLGKSGGIVLADADTGHAAIITLLTTLGLHPRVPSRASWQWYQSPCGSGGSSSSSGGGGSTSCTVVQIHPRL